MATNFPNEKDVLANPNSTDSLSAPSHSQQHANTNDALEAIQDAIGVTNSSDSNSLTYKVNTLSTTVQTLANQSTGIETLLGIEGNNDLTIAGIQNKTTIDSYASADYRTASYALQIVKTSTGESYFSNITALRGSSDIYVSESNIVTNANTAIATTAFESVNGIINLTVTPVSGEVTVRYFRTALK
jgi:hypothetical protein